MHEPPAGFVSLAPSCFGLLFGVNVVTWDRWNTSTVLVHVGPVHFAINLGRVRPAHEL